MNDLSRYTGSTLLKEAHTSTSLPLELSDHTIDQWVASPCNKYATVCMFEHNILRIFANEERIGDTPLSLEDALHDTIPATYSITHCLTGGASYNNPSSFDQLVKEVIVQVDKNSWDDDFLENLDDEFAVKRAPATSTSAHNAGKGEVCCELHVWESSSDMPGAGAVRQTLMVPRFARDSRGNGNDLKGHFVELDVAPMLMKKNYEDEEEDGAVGLHTNLLVYTKATDHRPLRIAGTAAVTCVRFTFTTKSDGTKRMKELTEFAYRDLERQVPDKAHPFEFMHLQDSNQYAVPSLPTTIDIVSGEVLGVPAVFERLPLKRTTDDDERNDVYVRDMEFSQSSAVNTICFNLEVGTLDGSTDAVAEFILGGAPTDCCAYKLANNHVVVFRYDKCWPRQSMWALVEAVKRRVGRHFKGKGVEFSWSMTWTVPPTQDFSKPVMRHDGLSASNPRLVNECATRHLRMGTRVHIVRAHYSPTRADELEGLADAIGRWFAKSKIGSELKDEFVHGQHAQSRFVADCAKQERERATIESIDEFYEELAKEYEAHAAATLEADHKALHDILVLIGCSFVRKPLAPHEAFAAVIGALLQRDA